MYLSEINEKKIKTITFDMRNIKKSTFDMTKYFGYDLPLLHRPDRLHSYFPGDDKTHLHSNQQL
jgi:hypothetical protein